MHDLQPCRPHKLGLFITEIKLSTWGTSGKRIIEFSKKLQEFKETATMNQLLLWCWYMVVYAALAWLIFQASKILGIGRKSESTAGIPPGNRGLPLIGETLQFMASIKSSRGFYDFVRVRRLR